MFSRHYFILSILLAICSTGLTQKIIYSNPDRNIIRGADFNVIGKFNDHYLIYKNLESVKSICIYDEKMKLIDNAEMNFLPAQLINYQIICYNNFFYFIYQYQSKDLITCAAAKMNASGKIMGEPFIIDTTIINFSARKKIYNVIASEDKQKILLYKADTTNSGKYIFTFSDTKEKYVRGIYCSIWDNISRTITASKEITFNNDYRKSLKPKLPSFNELQYLYIQDIEVKKDGGFVVMAEITFSLDEEKSDNPKFSYPYGSQSTSGWYYQDSGPEIRTYPWLSSYNLTSEDYYAYNIAVMSFNSNADMDWSTTIPKAQYSHSVYKFIGFGIYIISGKMHFLFNSYFKQRNFLQSINLSTEGEGDVNPTVNVLGKSYELMPKYGKQLSSNEIIIPCQYINYFCFAKLEF